MITIAVAAVLLMIAVPSFKHVIASTGLTATSNSLVNALHVARMEAIKRNNDTQFCADVDANNGSDTLGTACNNQVGAQVGAVFAVTGTVGTPVAVQVLAPAASTAPSTHITNVAALQFNAQGLAHEVNATVPYTGTVADVCSTAIDSGNHRIIRMTTGSIIATASSSGDCGP